MRSYNKTNRNTYRAFALGEMVYFHASVYPGGSESIPCKGFVIRQPSKDNPAYKVIIAEIIPIDNNAVPLGIVGKKLLRKYDQLSSNPPMWWDTSRWIGAKSKQYIVDTINRAKNEHKR